MSQVSGSAANTKERSDDPTCGSTTYWRSPMYQTAIPPPSWRATAVRRIEAINVAGPDTQHSRVMNPEAIQGLLRDSPDSIVGIARFERIPFKDVLDAQASVTGYSPSPTVTTGGG